MFIYYMYNVNPHDENGESRKYYIRKRNMPLQE